MATLEKEHAPVTSPEGAVPAPFPAVADRAEQQQQQQQSEGSGDAMRSSGSGSRGRDRSASRPRESFINKFKRAMSRDRVPSLTRRDSLTTSTSALTNSSTIDEDERGRSREPMTTMNKLSLNDDMGEDETETITSKQPATAAHENSSILKTISRSLSPSSRATASSTTAIEHRGRTRFQATGRGGAGNMLVSPDRQGGEKDSTSLDRALTRGEESPDDIARARTAQAQAERSTSRGREAVLTTGRGGAGNLRSQSRGRTIEEALAERDEDAKERDLLEKARNRALNAPRFGGRGGVGNLQRGTST